jgi:hypothetical protein
MDVLAATATTMDSEVTLTPAATPDSPIATTIATMELQLQWKQSGPPLAAETLSRRRQRRCCPRSKEEKGVEGAKRRGRRKNPKERNAADVAI